MFFCFFSFVFFFIARAQTSRVNLVRICAKRVERERDKKGAREIESGRGNVNLLLTKSVHLESGSEPFVSIYSNSISYCMLVPAVKHKDDSFQFDEKSKDSAVSGGPRAPPINVFSFAIAPSPSLSLSFSREKSISPSG